ncbi:TlpA family protein disulfide reductase [Aequorivita xiaoshiensis]|uniref:TlpA family protein disulfide reductase n=1 Tax=Aequorivita xiaoshiensis TaxID=2874476 RepID=A0A9X1R494_9FLAO|nr:TlpA disulfide reductase family protein [Aequorivita xiaoshiensis]MCG2431966.1 TlpA family protein disulfide reductase [Aequorivita xiaoshiensis]
MNDIFRIIILILLLSSCKKEINSDVVILKGLVEENDITHLEIKTNELFKLYKQPVATIKLNHSKNSFNDTLNVGEGYYDLTINEKTILVYLKNGFQLNFNISKKQIGITGLGEKENNYLLQRDKFDKNISSKNFSSFYSNLNEIEFLKHANSIYRYRINLIEKWNLENSKFKYIEETFAKLDKAHKYLNYPKARQSVDPSYIASNGFPKTFETIDINDERLMDLPFYTVLMFLNTVSEVHNRKHQSIDKSLETLKYVILDSLRIKNKKLKEEVAYRTIDWTFEQTDSLDKVFTLYKNYTKNEKYLNEITNRYLKIKGLSKGSPATNFTIRDSEGKLISLENLRGNIIYIDFWATWCKPCLSEIKPSSQLQEKLKDKEIKFLNICIESEYNTWKRMVLNQNIEGINLFADKEIEKKLKEDYMIQALPRYVIIDKNGKIYDFSAKRPSDSELEVELIKLL